MGDELPLVPILIQEVWRGTKVVYVVVFRKEFISKSLSVSSMEQVDGTCCLGRRGGEMEEGGSGLGVSCALEN